MELRGRDTTVYLIDQMLNQCRGTLYPGILVSERTRVISMADRSFIYFFITERIKPCTW